MMKNKITNLKFPKKGDKRWIKEEKGETAETTIKDVNQSNGEIHVINKLLLPE